VSAHRRRLPESAALAGEAASSTSSRRQPRQRHAPSVRAQPIGSVGSTPGAKLAFTPHREQAHVPSLSELRSEMSPNPLSLSTNSPFRSPRFLL
jgi:hypothetical protein